MLVLMQMMYKTEFIKASDDQALGFMLLSRWSGKRPQARYIQNG